MLSTVMRTLCVALWIVVLLLGYDAWVAGDWRRLIAQLAQALIAVVVWFAVPRGASEFRVPTVGTRAFRMALYASALLTAAIATTTWPLWLDDGAGSENAFILLVITMVMVPLLQAERRVKTSS
jgi:hypothetical protein